MIVVFACISSLILIIKINHCVLSSQYKLLNPITILCTTWMMVFFCHYLIWGNDKNMDIYITTTFAIIFLVIGFWSSFYQIKDKGTNYYDHIKYNNENLMKLAKLLIFFEVLRLLYFGYIIIYILSEGNWIRFIFDNTEIRTLYLNRPMSLIETLWSFIGSLFGYLGYIILALYCSLHLKNRWRYFTIITILELLLSIITMSKFSFVVYLLTFIVAYSNQLVSLKAQKEIIKKILPILFFVFFLFFLVIGLQRNYAETKGGLEKGVINGIITYFGGPFEAYSLVFKQELNISKFDHGMIDIGNSSVNVYTWFYYFTSATSLGIIFIPFMIGVVSGWCYRPRKNNFFYNVVDTYICIIFAMSFFDFLLKFTVFPILFLFTAFLNKYCKKIFYKRYNSNLCQIGDHNGTQTN